MENMQTGIGAGEHTAVAPRRDAHLPSRRLAGMTFAAAVAAALSVGTGAACADPGEADASSGADTGAPASDGTAAAGLRASRSAEKAESRGTAEAADADGVRIAPKSKKRGPEAVRPHWLSGVEKADRDEVTSDADGPEKAGPDAASGTDGESGDAPNAGVDEPNMSRDDDQNSTGGATDPEFAAPAGIPAPEDEGNVVPIEQAPAKNAPEKSAAKRAEEKSSDHGGDAPPVSATQSAVSPSVLFAPAAAAADGGDDARAPEGSLGSTTSDTPKTVAPRDIQDIEIGTRTQPVESATRVEAAPDTVTRTLAAVLSPTGTADPRGKSVDNPLMAALLAWVRRTFFNVSPELAYDPTAAVQGQYGVITGSVGATDPEGDAIQYIVTKGPQHGSLEIDQATGTFSYTPDLDYAQTGGTDSFVVKVTDNKTSLLDLFRADKGSPKVTIGLTVDSIVPSGQRFIVPLPDSVVQPQNAAFTADGTALVFRGRPEGTSRNEIYRVNLDGSGLQCLSCGLAPEITAGFSKPFVFEDGNRVLVSSGTQSDSGGETADHYILECNGGVGVCGAGSQLLKINVPTAVAPGVSVVQKERELRIAPDGVHVAFTQLLAAGTTTQLISAVGVLTRTEFGYDVEDARVVYVGGELKNFTPDGKGVMITDFSGKYNAGNADDVLVDLRDGTVSRLTTNLDYDESADMSPNGEWLALGSSRTLDYLTPMSQVVRPTFVPAYIVFPTFQAKKGTLNQTWVVSREDELAGADGLFLGDQTGAYTSVPVANWSPDGTAIAFWERSVSDPTDTHLVVAQLKNIDGGTMPSDVATPDISGWATPLRQVVPTASPLEPSRDGKVGGHAQVVTTKVGNTTTTTVTYTNFEDSAGFIINGTETTVANAALTNITYTANLTVTGADGSERGYLHAQNVKIVNQLQLTGVIESSVDGNHLVLGNPVV